MLTLENDATLLLTNSSPTQALALRRALIENVYTLAIRHVNVARNDGTVPDAELVHTLGLVPLSYLDGRVSTLTRFVPPLQCACEILEDGSGCARCCIRLQLCVTNDSDEPMDVWSHDLLDEEAQGVRARRGLPLSRLLKRGHCIELEATAVVGTANAKHVSTCPPAFYTTPFKVEVNPDWRPTEPQIEDLVACCPKKVFNKNLQIDSNKCHGCMECARTAHDFRDTASDAWMIKVSRITDTFRFPIESVGQLTPEIIAREASQHVGIPLSFSSVDRVHPV